jgi:rhodanese-related sulfurtransferase
MNRITRAELAARIAPDRAGTVVVYCSGPSCGRSTAAAAAFRRLGYTDVRVYSGGKLDWHDAGLPLEGTRAGAAVR